MPLLDHFHPPLSEVRHWEGFHSLWTGAIAGQLNARLPAGYFAEPQVHVGARVEVDVATFEWHRPDTGPGAHVGPPNEQAPGGSLTLAVERWTAPAASFVVPTAFPEAAEVRVFSSEAGPQLVAAVELVSPGNKDRPDARGAFASKCWAYLQRGIGVVLVDVVTNRSGEPHNELVGLMGLPAQYRVEHPPLSAATYRPVRRVLPEADKDEDRIHVWFEALRLYHPLPTMPLPLDKGQLLPLDLEASYTEARLRSRLPTAG